MIDVREKSKIHMHWKVSPYDYSKEKLNSLEAAVSKKYGIPKDKVTVIPEFIMTDSNGESTSINEEVIQNIQDPVFQIQLFREWLELNKITDCDFELIKKIDSEINAKIDYQIYDKYKRYSIKWIRWDNFLSYGADNVFDFTDIGQLVLLSSEPANQGGKTTFCIDLIRFLLFGTSTRYRTQAELFNQHLPEATTLMAEGCITIDGVDYIIKRTVSRPALERHTDKSKTVQKVEYYKIVGENKETLEDYVDNQQEENNAQTNKAIKEAIGRESDFDLIMSVTDKTLDDLVEKKETERGRLLARWIGLLPIEEKDKLAREKFNSEVKPFLLSNQYNTETLTQEIQAYEINIKTLKDNNKRFKNENDNLENEIKTLESTKATLLSSKKTIDDNLLKIDITTLKGQIEACITEGKKKNSELEDISKELNEIGDIDFSVEEFDRLQEKLTELTSERTLIGERYKNTEHNIKHLKSSEICPTCGRKLDNVDNSAKIAEFESALAKITEDGKKIRESIDKITKDIESKKKDREAYTRKSNLSMKKSALEVSVERLRAEYKEKNQLLKEYNENSEAIDKNNKIDMDIRNTDAIITGKRNTRDTNLRMISTNETEIKSEENKILDRKEIISKIKEEEKLVKNWKIYIDLVGKNGISKMVLRKTLPIINARLSQLLNDVCDFDIEVGIDAKNDVTFYLIKDGVYKNLHGGSGFELTAAALALRSVLAEMSTIPKCGIVVWDEVFGRVAKENYENLKNLVTKISKSYDSMILISHLDEIRDWCQNHIVVRKENNVSTLVLRQSV
jgi:DNA repair exonuclease SbcCD ATPase subunit